MRGSLLTYKGPPASSKKIARKKIHQNPFFIMTEHCSNCYYARRAQQFPAKDNKEWYSCRYHAPMPYANEKQTTYKDWRIVPEDFWCGQYKKVVNRATSDEMSYNPFDELY